MVGGSAAAAILKLVINDWFLPTANSVLKVSAVLLIYKKREKVTSTPHGRCTQGISIWFDLTKSLKEYFAECNYVWIQ